MTESPTYLFDTDALSEPLKKKPAPAFVEWLATIPRERQFTSAVVIGELFAGAFRKKVGGHHLTDIEERVLPWLSVIPYDGAVARLYGRIRAELQDAGTPIAVPDLQIAATAIHHDLELVTGNILHFQRIPGVRLCHALAEARGGEPA